MGVACLTRPNHVFLYAHRLSYRWRLHAIARESAIGASFDSSPLTSTAIVAITIIELSILKLSNF